MIGDDSNTGPGEAPENPKAANNENSRGVSHHISSPGRKSSYHGIRSKDQSLLRQVHASKGSKKSPNSKKGKERISN
jgi:hypothetical protein